MKKARVCSFLSLVVLLSVSSTMAGIAAVDLASLSAGSWITTNDNTGSSSRDSYFNTAKASAYFHIGKVRGYVGFPVTFTLEKYVDKIRWAVYPADLSAYVGLKVGAVEPRLGIGIPMGYPTSDTVAWIGSNNVKLVVGLGFKIGEFLGGKVTVGGETMGRVYVTGLPEARIDRGSNSIYLSLRTSLKLSNRFGIAFEAFPLYSYFTATEWDPNPWQSVGFLPLLSAQFSPKPLWSFSLKGGYGFQRSGSAWENRSSIVNVVLSSTLNLWRR